jgi:energy-coupling factor transporter ATP-binding protein EcfA2
MENIIIHQDFEQALQFINQTGEHVFLTGKAGTGKTTFLKFLKENSPKKMIVAAPTGVAAINCGGVTLHSLFGLPFGPFLPSGTSTDGSINNKKQLLSKIRYTQNKRTLIRELELLIIDEISMVRADVLDMVDTILRSVRRKAGIPFGGVQLLMIGDLFQLPPVVKNSEKEILSMCYKSEFFFDAWSLKERPPVCIQLKKIFRQKDQAFIDLLNDVRNNTLSEDGLTELNKRWKKNIDFEHFICLCSHNQQASTINQKKIQDLPGDFRSYRAETTGDFSENNFPVDETLLLKVGAKIMFTKNDAGENRRFFNGKLGVIKALDEDKIIISCEDSGDISLQREVWKNIQYKIDPTTLLVDENEIGTFTQFPLRLAWAITIHKSQGLTFDKVAIDAAQSFNSGQLYVALSRCRSLEGITLTAPIPASAVMTNSRVVSYHHDEDKKDIENIFENAKSDYHKKIIFSFFRFEDVLKSITRFQYILGDNLKSIQEEEIDWLRILNEKISLLDDTGRKFQNQLEKIYSDDVLVNERIEKAKIYFTNSMDEILEHIQNHNFNIDTKDLARKISEVLNEIFIQISLQRHCIFHFEYPISIEEILNLKKNFVLPGFRNDVYAGKTTKLIISSKNSYPILYNLLSEWRSGLAENGGVPVYSIASNQTLLNLTNALPQSEIELKSIHGIGEIKKQKYGKDILGIIQKFMSENPDAKPVKYEKSKSPNKKIKSPLGLSETVATTFSMWNNLKDIDKIASERNMVRSTIESHLAKVVEDGLAPVSHFLSKGEIDSIANVALNHSELGLKEIKEMLPEISYGSIRLYLANKK